MAAWRYEFYLLMLEVSLTRSLCKIPIPKRPCNVLFILKILMKFLHKRQLFLNSFSKQQNSAIKVVTYRKMPVTKML